MVSFQQLHSHLKLLSNNYLKGTRTESGFKRAFATLFGQDVESFTGTMFLNMDQLEKQLDNEEFQEIGPMVAFKTKSKEQDTNSRSGNDAHADDADIRPIYDEELMVEVQLIADHNVYAIGQQHTEQPEFNNEGEFAESSILGKPVLQPHKNQSVVSQPTAFKSERPRISKLRFASQVDVNNDLSKPVTTYYLPKEKEPACAKPHHMIAPG
ncbi:hypothetical protein Tco_1161402 [Tanacetum coccineum]